MLERNRLSPAVSEAILAVAALMSDPPPGHMQSAVIATTAAGAVAFWNDGAERLYGWTAQEALGRNIVDLTPASYSRDDAAAIMRRLQSGEPWEGFMVLRGRTGHRFLAYVVDLPLGDIGGEQGAIVGISLPAELRGLIDDRRRLIEAELHARLDSLRA